MSIAGRIGKKAVLIPSGDLRVVAVSRAGAALEAQYFLDLPTETMIGLRVPRAVVLDQGHDEQALDVLSMAVVLKPVDLQVCGAHRAVSTRRAHGVPFSAKSAPSRPRLDGQSRVA